MKAAVIADIHSNAAALEAVLADAAQNDAEALWVAGDVFGYGSSPCEVYRLLVAAQPMSVVLGNHDWWVQYPSHAPAGAGDGARENAETLRKDCPEAIRWLALLPHVAWFSCRGWQVQMTHGTPDDPLHGRHYPDDTLPYRWLPGPGEILVLGQTHYPILRGTAETGLLLNPGSVGQPRDGDPRSSWALLDTDTGLAELRRCET